MRKPRPRELKRQRIYRTRFFVLDGAMYVVSDRDEQGLEAVRLDFDDAEMVRRMRDEAEFEIEAAIFARRR